MFYGDRTLPSFLICYTFNMEQPINNENQILTSHLFKLFLEHGQITESDMLRLREQGVSIEHLLSEFVRQGYLLHGSGSLINELEPFPGDDDLDEKKRAVGVYATDLPSIAIFKATVSQQALSREFASVTAGWDIRNVDDAVTAVPYSTQPIGNAVRQGYIHVLPKENFVKIADAEYLSEVPVQPALVLPVEHNDMTTEVEVRAKS